MLRKCTDKKFLRFTGFDAIRVQDKKLAVRLIKLQFSIP